MGQATSEMIPLVFRSVDVRWRFADFILQGSRSRKAHTRMKSGNAVLMPGCICLPEFGLGEDNSALRVANWVERWREPSTAPHPPEGRRATDPDWLS